EDENLKLLRSLPSAWNNIALIMRNKSDLDTLSMDDLYNNLKVYEYEIKGKSSSSLNSQNVAFVSSDNSSSTNETVNTAHSISASSSEDQASTASINTDAIGNNIYRMFTPVNAAGSSCDNLGGSISVNAATLPNADLPTDPLMPDLEDTANLLNTGIFSGAYDDEDVGAEADFNNLETTMNVSPIPTTRIHKDYP
ncbi:hypothetical protein Tco_1223271, partial [Tanacetum coccineum]